MKTNEHIFFSAFQIPALSQRRRAILEDDISIDETKKAIRGLKKGKAPGNDGFSVDFYQKLEELMSHDCWLCIRMHLKEVAS